MDHRGCSRCLPDATQPCPAIHQLLGVMRLDQVDLEGLRAKLSVPLLAQPSRRFGLFSLAARPAKPSVNALAWSLASGGAHVRYSGTDKNTPLMQERDVERARRGGVSCWSSAA